MPALYGFPAPNQNVFSLIRRIPESLPDSAWLWLGDQSQTFNNTLTRTIHIELRVNDARPGDGAGAFRVRADYDC